MVNQPGRYAVIFHIVQKDNCACNTSYPKASLNKIQVNAVNNNREIKILH